MSVAFWKMSPFLECSWHSQSPLSRDPTFLTMMPQSVDANPKKPIRPFSWDDEESEKLFPDKGANVVNFRFQILSSFCQKEMKKPEYGSSNIDILSDKFLFCQNSCRCK
jgi:hypothetical protein